MNEMESKPKSAMLPPKGGIRKKIFLSFAVQFGLVLGLVFSIVMILDLYRMRGSFHRAQEAIAKAIVAKGKHQAMRTSMILAALPENGTSSLIREIIASTVACDPEIRYGIYMDADRKPLAYSRADDASWGASRFSASLSGPLSSPLADEMSLWASSVKDGSFRSTEESGKKIIEFAAPAKRGGLILGVVRFGVATESMDAALHEARQSWRKTKELTITLFGMLGFSTFLMAIWSSSVLSGRITRRIRALTVSAIRIANGDYRAKVEAEGEDEIALLAEAFETMRKKVKDYTGNLQVRVDENVRQIRDILDNVRQGLFTFNLDLNVNPDCSLSACQILGMDELAGHTLAEVLRLSPQDEALFRDWVDVLLMHYETHRWEKLAKLAPIREIRLGAGAGGRQIKVEYQKILDPRGRLTKIMVLIQDVTESNFLESRIWEEKIRLENKVRVILGITSNTPELVSEFLKDSTAKIDVMEKSLEILNHKNAVDYRMGIRIAYKDCHTIKGNAGAFGFEVLVELAHELETRLDNAACGRVEWPECLPAARRLVQDMKEEIKRMNEVRLLLSGNSEEVYQRLPESKIAKIRALANKAGFLNLEPELLALVDCCKTISYRSFASLARKYQDLVSRVSIKTQKDVTFNISPPGLELDPEVLLRVDEALVHLVRNAAVYGLDAVEGPEPAGLGSGKVELDYSRTSGAHIFTVKDHGVGIDPELLVRKAVATGILDNEAAKALGENEKLQLIFHPGFSTSDKPDSLSGRGMGLTIASESVRAWGGTISVASRPGLGSSFTITLPE
jgi:signal transduction histidine kinase/HAMP domain-containing protein